MWLYPQVVVFNGKVYIGGGEATSYREQQRVIVYDPKLDSYDTLPPYAYILFSMAVVNNLLVVVGGVDVQTRKVTNKLGVWSEQSKQWTHSLPPMTTACHSPSVATHNKWLMVMGGWGDGTFLSRVEILDTTEQRRWYHAAPLPHTLCRALPAAIGNMLYLLGGYTEKAASTKVLTVCVDEIISEVVSQPASASNPPTPSPWQSLPDTPKTGSTSLAFNGALLAVGGGRSPAIYHYKPSSRRWIMAGEMPTGRSDCTCTVLPSGDLFVAGGSYFGGGTVQVDIASVQ